MIIHLSTSSRKCQFHCVAGVRSWQFATWLLPLLTKLYFDECVFLGSSFLQIQFQSPANIRNIVHHFESIFCISCCGDHILLFLLSCLSGSPIFLFLLLGSENEILYLSIVYMPSFFLKVSNLTHEFQDILVVLV